MSNKLIQCLLRKYPQAEWFIRTKDMEIDWLKFIPEERFRLRVIGAEYVPNRSKIKKWFYGKEVNREVIDELKELALYKDIRSDNTDRWIIAIHDNNRIVALNFKGRDTVIGKSTGSYHISHPVNVGRSSILFASCIASLLGCYKSSIENMLQYGSINTYQWTESITKNIRVHHLKKTETSPIFYFRGDYTKVLKHAIIKDNNKPLVTEREFDAKDMIESWKCSFENLGIVTNENNEKFFHLWRGYSCIDKYITIREHLRVDLNKLYQSINKFRSTTNIKSSLNILLFGEPGWGKTFLAERIAATFDFNPILFNLAQLTSIEQVIDCFDAISSLQNQQKNRPILAFFDEIDTPVDGNYTLPLFLSPILDGTYRRGGRIFYLAPCVWIFAGSKHPTALKKAIKTTDFMSRINGPEITMDFRYDQDNLPIAMTEQVYLGVSLLLQTFDDVYLISEDILLLFHDLKMKHGVRSFQQAIRKFKNVQYGCVGRNNLPDYESISSLLKITKNHYYDIRFNKKDEEFIKIIESPDRF